MATTYTEHYKLGKQEDASDQFKMSVLTANMDSIDTHLYAIYSACYGFQEQFMADEDRIDALETGTYSLSVWNTVWESGADLDTVLTPGVYSAPTNAIAAECTNLPDGYTASGQAFKLIVEYTSTVNFLRQTLIGRTGVVYNRTYNVSSASFGSWERYITYTEFAVLEARVAALETAAAT